MNFRYRLVATLAAFVWTALPAPRSSIDPSSLDPSCKPCDNFWRYANGGWIDKNPIPSHRSSWGTLSVMTEANRERLRVILETAAAAKSDTDPTRRRIGDYYAACIDTSSIDARGAAPLQPALDRVEKISTRTELAAALAEFSKYEQATPFRVTSAPDYKESSRVIAHIGPANLSLPDRDYYFKSDARSVLIRDEFVKHAARMLELLGDPPDSAASAARTLLAFETSLAETTLTRVQRRDPYSRYHLMNSGELGGLTPAFDWSAQWRRLGIAAPAAVNVQEPEFLKRVQQKIAETPLADWKTWLRWRLLDEAAPDLSRVFADQDFYFRQTVLNGVKQQEPRWQVCAVAVDRNLGEALGREFAAKHFPAKARERMRELVENLRATLNEELGAAAWLTPETRKNALAKLNAFVAKIGHPDKWKDYSPLSLDRKFYFENTRAAAALDRDRDLAKIGKPVDRSEWRMTPPTVNAYYSPLQNEIVFPAGILQPPLFDMEADDAMNYGAIGAVIGHEMGHGFDDQGSKFDASGNLVNWWTAEDRAKFEQRAGCVIDQFNTLDVGSGLRHNGKLVVGEALGDLGGLTLAYRAYQRSLRGKPGPTVDGFTADQRFFLAFARVWSTHHREEAMRLRLNTDPHPLAQFRTNGTLQNMPEFHKAFQCKLGDAMVRPAEKQCKLW